ncbi:hypothetical protein [Dyadobacter pollutisoli]|uniref:Uncharacterized protein n=1 Tax=Dyadobacter pollutisoli TaxID=2910158 RepID=A0A9E8NA80_9BACT|nr:hypothetical protein [Dyadobacter pollutisoli]WAC12785.1 hypothetical protein ON006_02235 [Dyadobacter pollutisoli]
MMMKTQSKAKHEEGGTPSHGGPKGGIKQKDDSLKPARALKKESIAKSEKTNMTGKKGYNETPPTVPVKSTK